MSRLTLALMIAALALQPDVPQPFSVVFEGTVLDLDGHGVPDAEIRISGPDTSLEAVTDSEGRFRLSGEVTPGDYTIEVRAPGFFVEREPLTIVSGQAGATIRTDIRVREELLTTAPPPPPPPPPAVDQPPNRLIRTVFYATDRSRVQSSAIVYANTRNDDGDLALGRFDVSIPRDHRLANVERPSWWRLEFSEDPDRHFVIVSRTVDSYDSFYSHLTEAVGQSDGREAFVFIHGYNVAFEDAVYRTAQLSYDLGFDGASILYSWPSNGTVRQYTHDWNNSEWSVPRLRWFLEDVARRSGARTVHLIAHSMGNRVLSHALDQMAQGGGALPRFSRAILAAPDIDAGVFRQLAENIKRSVQQVTIYASANDRALQLSKEVHGFVRAGDASPACVIDGIDTVDASLLSTDFLGHSYYGDHDSVISDIRCLLEGTSPERRWGLARLTAAGRAYWRFVRNVAEMACSAPGAVCACAPPR